MVLRMARTDTTMTVQAPRDIWRVIRGRAERIERDDLAALIDDAVSAVDAEKQSIRLTAPTDEATALYDLSVMERDE